MLELEFYLVIAKEKIYVCRVDWLVAFVKDNAVKTYFRYLAWKFF